LTSPEVKVDGRRTSAREEIKAAAVHLFHERGFNGVSVRDIMDQLGLTAAAMYNHFESKEILLYVLILDSAIGIEEFIADALSVADDESDPAAQLAALSYAHALFQCMHPQLARVGVNEMQNVPLRDRRELRERLQNVRHLNERVTIAGIAAGVFEVPYPEVVVMAFLGMGIKISDWYHTSGRLRPETIAALHAKMVLRMVGFGFDEDWFEGLRRRLVKVVGRTNNETLRWYHLGHA
jgi:AcrR family transcriptional regulator